MPAEYESEITADSDSQEARPATWADVKALMQALQKNHVDYLLIGGYALNTLGYQRATTDIDILLRKDLEQGERVQRSLEMANNSGAAKINLAWFGEGGTIRVSGPYTVDLLFNPCGESYESLLPYKRTIELEGIEIHTLTVEGMLKTKQSSRMKDRMDRLILERALQAWNEQNQKT